MSDGPQRAPSKARELSLSGLGKPAVFVLKFVISASLIVFLLSRLEFQPPPLTGAVIALMMLCLALLLLQPFVMSLRWWLLMRASGLDVSFANALRFNWMAIFANQFLPASVGGDAVRIVLSRMRGMRATTVTLSVLFDRGFALLAMFILILLLIPAVSDFMETDVVIVLAVVVCLAGFATLAACRYLAPHIGRFVGTIPRLAFLQHYISRVADPTSNWTVMISALALSFVVHLLSLFPPLRLSRTASRLNSLWRSFSRSTRSLRLRKFCPFRLRAGACARGRRCSFSQAQASKVRPRCRSLCWPAQRLPPQACQVPLCGC